MGTRHVRVFALCFVLLLIAAVLMFQQPAQTFANPDTMVDNFDTNQTINIAAGSVPTSQWSAVAGGSVIGGEREITATVTAIGGSNQLDVIINGSGLGRLAHSQGVGVIGSTLLTYDGTDNNPNLNYTGLGGVNLTANGDDAFIVVIHSNNFGDPDTTVVTIYSDATRCSTLTLNLPEPGVRENNPNRVLVFRYSDFGTCAGFSNGATFNSVGAIQVLIDGLSPDNDVSLDLLESGRLDYGDLPSSTPNYQAITLLGNNGAGHVIVSGGLRLGSQIDGESDGQQNPSDSKRDNTTGTPNDEDGVGLQGTQWNGGGTNQNTVTVVVAGGDACLTAWMDWNNDGDFNDTVQGASERIILNALVTTGNNSINFTVPTTATGNLAFFSRWRLYTRNESNNTCTFTGFTPAVTTQLYNGEVEDHNLGFNTPTAVSLNDLTAQAESNRWLQFGALGVLLAGVVVVVFRRK